MNLTISLCYIFGYDSLHASLRALRTISTLIQKKTCLHDDLVGDVALELLVGQADAVLDPNLVADGTVLAQDGDALDLDAVLDDARRVVGDGQSGAFDTGPCTDLAVPPDDGVHDAGVVLDLAVLEDDGLLDAHASADGDARADGDVGAKLGGGIDVGAGVDVDRGDDVCGGSGKLFGASLEGLEEVEGVGWDGRAGSLDLAPEVLGLEDEELARIGNVGEDVLLEADDEVRGVLFVVLALVEGGLEVLGGGVREQAGALGATLDGGADGGEDAFCGEEVDTAVDQVGDVALGLLDVVQHALGVGVRDDASEVGGRLVGDSCAEHDGLGILVVEQTQHLLQREGRADVGVEDKQLLGSALEDDIAEVVETTGGTQRLVLAQVLDAQLGPCCGDGVDEGLEDGFLIVTDNEDFLDLGDGGDGAEAVLDDGVAGDGEQWLVGDGLVHGGVKDGGWRGPC